MNPNQRSAKVPLGHRDVQLTGLCQDQSIDAETSRWSSLVRIAKKLDAAKRMHAKNLTLKAITMWRHPVPEQLKARLSDRMCRDPTNQGSHHFPLAQKEKAKEENF